MFSTIVVVIWSLLFCFLKLYCVAFGQAMLWCCCIFSILASAIWTKTMKTIIILIISFMFISLGLLPIRDGMIYLCDASEIYVVQVVRSNLQKCSFMRTVKFVSVAVYLLNNIVSSAFQNVSKTSLTYTDIYAFEG